MKASGALRDEICYPFIYEPSWLCDYEVATDELCGLIGAVLSLLPPEMADIAADLDRLQPLAFHLNGSLRGRLAVNDADVDWLRQRLDHYRAEVCDGHAGFILPRGEMPVPYLYQGTSAAKRAVRLMVRVEQEGREIPDVLPRLCNLMGNFFFVLARVINRRRGEAEIPFVSKSYG